MTLKALKIKKKKNNLIYSILHKFNNRITQIPKMITVIFYKEHVYLKVKDYLLYFSLSGGPCRLCSLIQLSISLY